jgi:hypothetical protein
VEVRNSKLYNRLVIPYNPSLLMIFNCHINVVIFSSIKAVKYLYNYIYKGFDGASYLIDHLANGDTIIDEIKRYRDARCVTPPEEAYMLFGFSFLSGVSTRPPACSASSGYAYGSIAILMTCMML